MHSAFKNWRQHLHNNSCHEIAHYYYEVFSEVKKKNPGCKVNSNIHMASLKLTKPIWCFPNSVENFFNCQYCTGWLQNPTQSIFDKVPQHIHLNNKIQQWNTSYNSYMPSSFSGTYKAIKCLRQHGPGPTCLDAILTDPHLVEWISVSEKSVIKLFMRGSKW